MKLYAVVTITKAEEFTDYIGTNFDAAQKAKANALTAFENLSSHDKTRYEVDCRVYNIDDHTDTSDLDEIYNAIFDTVGYDLF